MDPFITRLDLTADHQRVFQDLTELLSVVNGWGTNNQIGLRCRPGSADPWRDATGSLTDPDGTNRRASERDFTEWCPGVPIYTRSVLEALASVRGCTWGRVRFMMSLPKRGLSMHRDTERRYHLALVTNPSAILSECFTDQPHRCTGWHIPSDGHWHLVDTRREHFAYNGGWEPRIHLVACALENG